MKKKFLALVLTLAMVLSLAPVGALATDGEESQKPEDVIYNTDAYESNAKVDGVDSLNKTAVKTGENTYDVTLEVKMHETTTTSINSQSAATVLVIDVSNSMDWHVLCGRDEHEHNIGCLGGLICGETEHTHTDACGESRLDAAKKAAENFVNTYAGSVENAKRYLSIVVFGDTASLKLDWTDVSTSNGKSNAKSAIERLKVDGGTNLEQGLAKAKDQLSKDDVAPVNFKNVVALTDGAPTCAYSGYGQIGYGTSGSAQINEATSTTATAVKQLANLYTVCFGAENTTTYSGGPTVGNFLKNSIASKETGKTYAYNADDASDLNEAFKEISQTITSGLSAGTVHDALPRGVTSSDADFTADWDLSSFTKTEEKKGDRTDYTYTKTYTVTIDPEEINPDLLDENDYYPLNGQTTLKVNVDNKEQELNFQIPYGKVTFNTYSVTYQDGVNGTVFEDNTTNDLRKGATIPGFAGESSIEREGYTFSGWKWYQGETELTAKPDTMPAANLVAVAQWTAKTYTVTYKIDGRVYGTPEEYTCGTEVTVKNIPTKTGYTFKGWTISDGAISDGKFVMPAKNVELTGSWTAKDDVGYTVHYYKKGTTDKVAEDKKVTGKTFNTEVTETAKTVSGYTVEGDSTQTITLDAYNEEITFYYTANTYTVTWMNGDIQLEKDENVDYNAQPSYGGTMPTKAADSEYTYQFAGWSKTDGAETGTAAADLPAVTENVIYYAAFTKTAQTYTVIFDAKGGNWSENETQKTGTYNGSSASVTRPGEPTKSGYSFVAWTYEDTDGSYQEIPNTLALTVNQLMNLPKADKANRTVTLYAKWRLNPEDQITYTIHQHFMKDEKQELGAQNYIELKEVQAGTAISTLIPSDTKVEFDGRTYLYEANNTTVNKQKYKGTEEITGKDTVIDLYYYLDSWKDGDVGPGDKTDDSLTGGDGIPDYKQILIQYQVYQKDNGLVTPEFEVVTVKNGNELTAIHGSSVTKAGTGYTFVTWTGQNVAVTETTVGDIIDKTSAEKLKNPKCDPSGDTFEQGKSYTYTAIFLEDKIGSGDNKDQPDGIPDRYQVTINYVSSDTSKGSVGTLTKEVLTIYENGKEGKWASKGKVVASGSTANATGSRCYFSNWTNTAGLAPSYNATLGQQTIENAEGGKTYTFTANFDRSSGGGGGGGGGTVTIPDDVPTGLNGKDHYAYVVGYPDGMVYPQKNITRAEVATIFFRLLEDETREANMTKSNSYNDMKDGAWYTCAVSTLSKMGIIKGYEDGSFKPDASISRAEFAAIAARFDPDGDTTPATFSDVSSHWAKDEISIAANHGWIKGYEDGSFKPDQKITRAETMTLVNRVLKRLPETKDDLHKDMKTWPDNQNESAWFYLAVQEATNSHYQKLKKDGIHETWESMRETRDWAALEK